MDLETAFSLCSLAVMPSWALLVLAPRWSWTWKLAHTLPIPVLLCIAYQALRLVRPELEPGAGLLSLEAFMIAVASPWGALVTWVHILVVDLFVGAWVARDAQRVGIPQLWLAPCLMITFVAAPLGLGLYLAGRGLHERSLALAE